MKREARIIAPILDNDGQPVTEALQSLERRLVQSFGGFTRMQHGTGGWADKGRVQVEGVIVYDVAVETTDRTHRTALHSIANLLRMEAKQQAVYLRYPSGEVELVEGSLDQYPQEDRT